MMGLPLAGLLLPILGALPDALIIVVSGLGGTKEQAAEQVTLNYCTLAIGACFMPACFYVSKMP